ncbi:MAG: hypothetical protein IJV55_08010 [Paludibacteraceae bacterium]|nr:hypothetical protein [Paludibacteraceae bacterium]MBQ9706110.1 hypothetical protein [Paludibacteraceae bacterium]
MNKDNEELMEFDDEQAVRFIWDFIPEEDRTGMTEDDILYVLDVIDDYYEKEGLLDDDIAEEAEIDEEKMFLFVKKAAQKDNVKLTDEQIQLILEGEFEYGVSIGIYEAE